MQGASSVGLSPYQSSINAMLRRLAADNAVQRIWTGDASLWHPSHQTQERIRQRLGWLGLPDAEQSSLVEWVNTLMAGDYLDVLVVATGAASAAARVWRAGTPVPSNGAAVHLLDSLVPSVVDAVLAPLHAERTAIVLIGVELPPERMALCTVALEYLGVTGADTGQIYVVTAASSPLGEWVQQRTTAQLLELPRDVSERFGTLSALGLASAVMARHSLPRVVQKAQHMRAVCRNTDDVAANPGAWLGTVLGVLAQHGRDTLTLLAPPTLAPLVEWIASFVAGSLSKHGRGFVPVVDEPRAAPQLYRNNRIFVYLSWIDHADAPLADHVTKLEAAGQPVLRFQLMEPADIAAEIARWEVAVAVAAMVIGLNPFDEPDTVGLQRYMQGRLDTQTFLPAPQCSVVDQPQLRIELQQLLSNTTLVSYLALVCYFAPDPTLGTQLHSLQQLLLSQYGLTTIVVFPLHDHASSVQLLHAGRGNGLMVALTTVDNTRETAQGLQWTLNDLCQLRLAADLLAWQQMRREYLCVRVEQDLGAGLQILFSVMTQIQDSYATW